MKRFRNPTLCLILISLLMCPPVPIWAGVGNDPRGDVNADGFVDGFDMLGLGDLLVNRAAGFVYSPQADFNQDSETDVADVLALSNYDGDWDDDGVLDIDDDYPTDPGDCASGGGPFKEGYNVVSGVDRYGPVDVYIPGCPPTPHGAAAWLDHPAAQDRCPIDQDRSLVR